MTNDVTRIKWSGENPLRAMMVLRSEGGLVVSPTKVGYILMTTDAKGLERKFTVKNRKRSKSGVVLCGSMAQLTELADMSPKVIAFYQNHWDQDILLGCILPWKDSGLNYVPNDGSDKLMMDKRRTSCFVIRFGTPSEKLVQTLWAEDRKLVFSSLANPSGKGNRGLVSGIGPQIEQGADLIIDGDTYVASIQPDQTEGSRYEQGVMVSMVDDQGQLVPEKKGQRQILPAPVLIRKGLSVDTISALMSEHFNTWDYRQGAYD